MKKPDVSRSALHVTGLLLVLVVAVGIIAQAVMSSGLKQDDLFSLRGPKGSILEGLVPLCTPLVIGLWIGMTALLRRRGKPVKRGIVGNGVVLIIFASIIFSIVYPVYLGSRGKAYMISCVSNVKQLSQGLLQYTQDWDETLPPANQWASGIASYAPNEALLHCPRAKSPYSYAFNQSFGGHTKNEADDAPNTVLLFEADATTRNAVGTKTNLTTQERHNGGLTYGFLDGHVRWHHTTSNSGMNWQPHPSSKAK